MAFQPAHSDAEPFSIASSLQKIQSFLSPSPTPHGPQSSSTPPALPSPPALALATAKIHSRLPAPGLGPSSTLDHILHDLTPGFNGSKTSPNYYGFVTGGVLPVAEAADRVVSAWDQNVQVHLPAQGVATGVEWAAGALLCELLGLEAERWTGRTFTTGATASNVLGMACGREAVLVGKIRAGMGEGSGQGGGREDGGENPAVESVGELGLLEASRLAGVEGFQVLTTMGHSSLSKAASIVGLGRKSVIEVGLASMPWKFDMKKLENALERKGMGSIVVVSCGEVNTGRYATSGLEEMKRLRELCDRFGAWLHVDGAFGLFARALPLGDEFRALRESCEGIELADSITGDAHKSLNVPYDCGFFLSASHTFLTNIFANPNAAYLSSASSPAEFTIPSPLNIGIENSRRFRALPVYAVLVAHGQSDLSEMFARQVRLARLIAAFLATHLGYELLPARAANSASLSCLSSSASLHPHAEIGIIVLFRAVDEAVNADLARRINRSGKIMVSGTAWEGRPAVRIAVSTWMVEEERDLRIVMEVLEGALL